MWVHTEIVYGFNMPQDYDELMQFEANEDLSRYRKTEDTIAIRYTAVVNATYPYKPKNTADTPQTEAVVKPYKPTNREILDAIENSDCPWK